MALLPQEIIRAKRDGRVLPDDDISAFVRGLTDGSVSEGQVAAFAMAVYFRGMTIPERVALTRAMTNSGTVLSWDLPGPVVDKHSTGGVGDTVSLMLAPMVAACGGFVPMISGRGLGHTGGTLDKFDAIPGYRSQPDLAEFQRVVRNVGCAVVGATADLAPADRRLYAIRDVTATVESIPLITASILSKKLAEGVRSLVLDVKVGSGAFLPDMEAARTLARSLVSVANGAGLACTALLTDMHQPLGNAAGNAVEMAEAIDFLTGAARDPRLTEVTLALAAEALTLCGLCATPVQAHALAETRLNDGSAAERFARMVAALGGPHDLMEHSGRYLLLAPIHAQVFASAEGFVSSIDTRALGVAIIALGGGRRRATDSVDHRVGLTGIAQLGTPVTPRTSLAQIHAATTQTAEAAAKAVRAAYRIGAAPPQAGAVVIERITG